MQEGVSRFSHGHIAVWRDGRYFLAELGLEFVQALKTRREVRTNAHKVVLGKAALTQLAAFIEAESIAHVHAHGTGKRCGIVPRCPLSLQRADRP